MTYFGQMAQLINDEVCKFLFVDELVLSSVWKTSSRFSEVRRFSFNYLACEIKLLSLQFKKVGKFAARHNVVVVFTENHKLQFLHDDDARHDVTKPCRRAKVVDS